MRKLVGLVVVLLVSVGIAELDHGVGYPEAGNEKQGPCGKFSTLRTLTHKLRHCEKAARDVNAPVSSQCCNDLLKVSIPCLYAVFSSDTFKKVGVDPKVAITIPHRCHFGKP
ncbi:hypothetical protein VNO78_28227 [Psophocarpus tetragonolobus]|uniref:Bifunctional inhibitor/plant lipid transfer protein/seed storage helical domain-containing protein n=1 Tax=Psophocarpus tetragonolobus TaxID=3891 RepID=A0AAN9S2F9_PSOTE